MNRVVGFFVACIFAGYVNALNFSSVKLQGIAQALGFSDSIEQNVTHRGRALLIEKDSNCVTHIGYDLFPAAIRQSDALAFKFIERYLLQLHLPHPQGATPAQQMNSDAVNLAYGTWDDLLDIEFDSLTQVSLNQDGYRYHFALYRDYNLMYELTFPNDYQLLTGKNKIELERQFLMDIQQDVANIVSEPFVCEELDTVPRFFNIKHGESLHFFKELKNDLYICKDTCGLLFNPELAPEATMLNVLQEVCDSNYIFQTTYVFYNQKMVAPLRLNNWINYVKRTECELYVGLAKKEKGNYLGVCVAYNKNYNYVHLMNFSFPIAGLTDSNQTGTAKIHAFVDLSRIKEVK